VHRGSSGAALRLQVELVGGVPSEYEPVGMTAGANFLGLDFRINDLCCNAHDAAALCVAEYAFAVAEVVCVPL